MNDQPLPASTVLPIEALVDPLGYLARYLEQPPESLRIVSVEPVNPENMKVRYLLLP